MSQFLPETMQPTPQAAPVNFTPPGGDASGDVALMQRVLSAAVQNPSLIPPDFMAYMVDFIQTSRLSIPIGQVFGFSRFAAESLVSSLSDATASATPVNPPTNGAFALTDISSGSYIVSFGADMIMSAAASLGRLKLFVNGADSGSEAVTSNAGWASCASVADLSLINPANTLALKMMSDDGVTTFTIGTRYLIAQRYANL